jgi:acetolactate synthase-1/2/3 large subunit
MSETMNGAEALLRSLHASGVDVCFANPGTSEMMFVDALDRTGLMRCVLTLFEGVATGAADGYARMAGKPAATLLHLGPGFANAAANIHNARKARVPMVNIVGDHALRHLVHDAPLTTDVSAIVTPFSHWVRACQTADGMGPDGAEAAAAAASWPGQIATLIAPGCAGWDPGGHVAEPLDPHGPEALDAQAVEAAAAALRAGDTLLWLGGSVLADPASLALAHAIAAATGAALLAPTSNRRIERGAGLHAVDRLPYPIDMALDRLAPFRAAVLVEAAEPVAFFAYPGKPSLLLPPGCRRVTLASRLQDGRSALAALADRLGVDSPPAPQASHRPAAPAAGPITPESLAQAIAAALPERAIVVDEGITAGRAIWGATAGCPPHSWLSLTGGAIGDGLPMATGAAIACPDRPVIGLQADGSAMYTIQSLWTQAREGLDVTTIVFANRGYEILKQELFKVGANPGRGALDLLEMARPEVNFTDLARGMGVPATRVTCSRALFDHIVAAVREPGPHLLEAML